MMMTTCDTGDFLGAKCALFIGAALVVLRRDDRPGLLWPGALDLPGGGREPFEMRPEETVLREIQEEIGLSLAPSDLSYARRYTKAEGHVWFFAAHLAAGREREIVFGDEGQGWHLMAPEAFVAAPDAVDVLQMRLRDYLGSIAQSATILSGI